MIEHNKEFQKKIPTQNNTLSVTWSAILQGKNIYRSSENLQNSASKQVNTGFLSNEPVSIVS